MEEFVQQIMTRLEASHNLEAKTTIETLLRSLSMKEAERVLKMSEKEFGEFLCLLEEQTDDFVNTVLKAAREAASGRLTSWEDIVKQNGWNYDV